MAGRCQKAILCAIPGVLALLGCWWLYSRRKKDASSSGEEETATEEQRDEAPEASVEGREAVKTMDFVHSGCAMQKTVTQQNSKPEETSTKPILISWQIEFPKALVGRLIGKQGRFMDFLKQASGAKMYVSSPPHLRDSQACHMEVGTICAALGLDGAWLWARVNKHFEETSEVELCYMDYGGYDRVKIVQLRRIRWHDSARSSLSGADILCQPKLSPLFLGGAMAEVGNDSSLAEGMAPSQRAPFPPEKLCMEWQQQRDAGAGLHNLGNTCFLNSVLQCLTYTPPLANYLLSGEHSRLCVQQGLCMMCIMEAHVNKVLHTSGSAIKPSAVISALTRIGEHFKLGMQEDAHEFLRYTVDAMQRACLSGSSDWDFSSQATTVVHQIFGGSLRSRVTCLSCKAVSDSYEPFLDMPLDIKAAASVTAALEGFVEPEQMDGENCLQCRTCDKRVAASKGLTIHHAPNVLTLCLKRFQDLTGRKEEKVVEYPEHLDLGPYTTQTAGEPLLYSLYAVLVHSGGSCHAGHYFCYIKASNGLWYKMDDVSVERCSINTVCRKQAYLLFYVRQSDWKIRDKAASSPAPSSARSLLGQRGGDCKQAGSGGPVALPPRTELSSQPQGCSFSKPGVSPSSRCQRKRAREGTQSSAPQRGSDVCSWSLVTTDYEPSAGKRRRTLPKGYQDPRDDGAPGPSSASSKQAPRATAAWKQSMPRQREQSRLAQQGSKVHAWFVGSSSCEASAGRKRRRTVLVNSDRTPWDTAASPAAGRKRRRTVLLCGDHTPWGTADAGPSSASSHLAARLGTAQKHTMQRRRRRSRSLQQDDQLHGWFVNTTSNEASAGRKRRRTVILSGDHTPRDSAASGPSHANSHLAVAPWTAQQHPMQRQRWQSRSLQRDDQLHGCVMRITSSCEASAGKKRRRTMLVNSERSPRDTAASGPSSASSLLATTPRTAQQHAVQRQRWLSRSLQRDNGLHGGFMGTSSYEASAGRRRRRTVLPALRGLLQHPGPAAPAPSWVLQPGLQRQQSSSTQQGNEVCTCFVEAMDVEP